MPVNVHFHLVQRLIEWADWVHCRVGSELSYPHVSLEARLREEGGLWRGLGQCPTPSHANAEEVEAWISTFAQHYPIQADVLRAGYQQRGSLAQKAKACGLTSRDYQTMLDQAHFWLEGYWCAEEARKRAT